MPLVLTSPRSVFVAMRDDSPEASGARQEPVLLLVLLAGIAAVLSFSVSAGELLDDPAVDGILVAVMVFLGGGIYGFAAYWLGGAALYWGERGARGEGSYRQARHVLAYAMAPMALSLVVIWPVRLALYGSDNFRTGGADHGAGAWVFAGITLGFLVWSLVLVLLGVRELNGWTTIRSLGAMLLTVIALLMVATVALVLGRG